MNAFENERGYPLLLPGLWASESSWPMFPPMTERFVCPEFQVQFNGDCLFSVLVISDFAQNAYPSDFERNRNFSPTDCLGQSCGLWTITGEMKNLNLRRIWRFVEGNPVNDGVIFGILALAYDLAVKILSDTPAGGVLYGYRIDETSFTERCVSPLNKCGHDFPAKTLPVRAFLEPKAEFWRN